MNSTTGRRDLPPGDRKAMAILAQPPKSAAREDLIEASILVQRTLLGPGFGMSEAELRQSAERRTDRAPYDPAGIARQWAAVVAAAPRNAGLKTVRRPALVIHGDADPLFPVAAAKDTAESIPGAKLVVVPGLGHSWPESAAAGRAQAHRRFRCERGSAGAYRRVKPHSFSTYLLSQQPLARHDWR